MCSLFAICLLRVCLEVSFDAGAGVREEPAASRYGEGNGEFTGEVMFCWVGGDVCFGSVLLLLAGSCAEVTLDNAWGCATVICKLLYGGMCKALAIFAQMVRVCD